MIQFLKIRMVLKQFSLPSTKKKNALLPAYKQLLHLLTFTKPIIYTVTHLYDTSTRNIWEIV
jgi:hypothetical protein